MQWYSYAFLALFGLISVVIGLYQRPKSNEYNDFFLASRTLDTKTLVLTLLATHIGGGIIIGTAQLASTHGYWGLLYNIGVCIGFLVLGLGFSAKLRESGYESILEVFTKKYKSETLQKISSFIFCLSMFGILVAQIVASKSLFNSLFEYPMTMILAFWGMVIFYTMFGGFKAVVTTDVIQVIVIFVVMGGLFVWIFSGVDIPSHANTWMTMTTASVPQISPVNLFVIPVCYALIEQDLAQRFMAAKNPAVCTKACLISFFSLFLFCLIPISLGMLAGSSGFEVKDSSLGLMQLTQKMIGSGGTWLLAIALLMAIASTADSLLCAIGSNLVKDSHLKLSPQAVTLMVSVGALGVGLFFDSVLVILIKSYSIPVVGLFVSMMFGFFKEKPSHRGAYLSLTIGVSSILLLSLINDGPFDELISLGLSYLGYRVGARLDLKSVKTQSV